MRVAEVFGPTIQGEGPSAGHVATFIRLSGCNLDCSWCDTPYTWDWTGKNGTAYDRAAETTELSADQLAGVTRDLAHSDLVVITGGEPLIQQAALSPLCEQLRDDGFRVEIETNGTLVASEELLLAGVRFNVSPKLDNSGIRLGRRWRPEILDEFGRSGRASFKFVCRSRNDVDEAANRLLDGASWVRSSDVWVMPEGRTTEEVLTHTPEVMDGALHWGFNFSTRLHVLAWGDQRGR